MGLHVSPWAFLILWLNRTTLVLYVDKQLKEIYDISVLCPHFLNISSFLPKPFTASPPITRVPRFASRITVLTYIALVFHSWTFSFRHLDFFTSIGSYLGCISLLLTRVLCIFLYHNSYTGKRCYCPVLCSSTHFTFWKITHCYTFLNIYIKFCSILVNIIILTVSF